MVYGIKLKLSVFLKKRAAFLRWFAVVESQSQSYFLTLINVYPFLSRTAETLEKNKTLGDLLIFLGLTQT